MSADNKLAGIALMGAAFCIFALTGAIAKLVLPSYSVGQVILFRSVTALIVLLPFLIREGATAIRAMSRPKLQFARVLISVGEVAMFFLSLSFLPLADTTSVFMSGPLFVAAWSIVFLGERIEWQRAAAILVGFVGVIIALRPSAATISMPALIALTGTMLYAGTVLTTRALRGTPGVVLTTNQMAGAALLGAVWAASPQGWLTPAPFDFAVLVLIGVTSAIAYLCMNRAITLAPANVVAPFQYTLVIWAALFGYMFFGDVPSLATWIGAAIIAGAGLYLSWREQSQQSASANVAARRGVAP